MQDQQQQLLNLLAGQAMTRHSLPDAARNTEPAISSRRKARKMDLPILADPDALDLVLFSDWKSRWEDYITMTCVYEEVPNATGRQAVLRSALSKEWTVLWSAGRLGNRIR